VIRFFRNSYLIQYLAIALLIIALWIPSFVMGNVDVAWRSPVTPLYNLMADILDFWPPAMLVFAMLLMGFEAMFFNSILASNQIIGKVYTLGAVAFLLMLNLLPVQTTFYPFLLSSVFQLMFIHTMFAIYQTPRPELYLLNAGFYVSFASMCWLPSLLLAVWGIVALAIIHKGSLRLHLIPFIGLLLPYFFFFAVRFLMGDLMPVLQAYGDYFTGFRLTVEGLGWPKVVLLGFLVLVLFVPMFAPHLFTLERSVAVRTKIAMTYNLLLLGIFLLFVESEPMRSGVLFIALSILFSYYLSYLDRLKWPNITFIILVVGVLAAHYIPLFL
jgi:hypothetical protein